MSEKQHEKVGGSVAEDAAKRTSETAAKPDHRVQSTALFRAMNFELYVKPNIVVMGIGIVSVTACVAYIAYWRATGGHNKKTYMALNEQGELEKRVRVSKWD